MRTPLLMAAVTALALPAGAFASGEFEPARVEAGEPPQRAATLARFPLPALGIADWKRAEVLETGCVKLPPCPAPKPLPLAELPRAPAGANGQAPQVPAAPKEIMLLVQKLAPQYSIDSDLALAVMWAESSFDPNAVSAANARGLMQLIPETAERFGVRNAWRIDENIKGGLAYLRWLLAYFRGDVSLALAGYNAGEGAVDKHGGIPPYAETREYVQKIIGVYRRLVHPYNPGVVGPSPLISQPRRTM